MLSHEHILLGPKLSAYTEPVDRAGWGPFTFQ